MALDCELEEVMGRLHYIPAKNSAPFCLFLVSIDAYYLAGVSFITSRANIFPFFIFVFSIEESGDWAEPEARMELTFHREELLHVLEFHYSIF